MPTCLHDSSRGGSFRDLGLRRGLAVALLLALAPLVGCGDDDDSDPGETRYRPQTSAPNVMYNFVLAHVRREPDQYARLLADDFRFYFDPQTRNQLGVQYWAQLEDSIAIERLLQSPDVSDVKLLLGLNTAFYMHTGEPAPRDTWLTTQLRGSQVLFEVDVVPTSGGTEPTIYQVRGDPQRFYFRRGRSATPAAGDTLFYLVEWRDEGNSLFAGRPRPEGAGALPLSESTTWSGIKMLIGRWTGNHLQARTR